MFTKEELEEIEKQGLVASIKENNVYEMILELKNKWNVLSINNKIENLPNLISNNLEEKKVARWLQNQKRVKRGLVQGRQWDCKNDLYAIEFGLEGLFDGFLSHGHKWELMFLALKDFF